MYNTKPLDAILALLKLIVSVPYQLGHLVHSSFYSIGLLQAQKLPRPVISVGNISFGGSGKTPFTIELAKHLSDQGYKVGILSRGYKSSASKTGRVVIAAPDERSGDECNEAVGNLVTNLRHSVEEIGDEPYMMLEKFKTATNPDYNKVIISRNRFRGAMQALTVEDFDVFILDDGMQHLPLHRDVEITLVNIHERGFMREFPLALSRADFVVYTKVDQSWIDAHPNQAALRYKLKLLADLDPAREICVVTAIADPQSFVKELSNQLSSLAEASQIGSQSYSNRVIHLKSFPDHHYFSVDEVKCLKSLGMNLVCTLKDFVKIPESEREAFIVADLELEVHPSDLFTQITGTLKNGK